MSNIPARLRPHVQHELSAAAAARRRKDVDGAWRHLERAHILSQPAAWLHNRVHLAMLVLSVRTRDGRELWGQIVRLAVATVASLSGRFPGGNTGRARVPITQSMPVPADILQTLESVGAEVQGVTVWGGRRAVAARAGEP